jgi:type I restriction enzyme S subunit
MIPKGWKVGSLGDSDFSEIIGSGINKFTNEKIYLATADVADTNIINKETLITYENRASRANMQPINNSIWFAKMQNSRKLLMFDGNTDKTFSYILSTGFAGIRTTELSHYFIWTFVLSNSFNNSKNNLANGAVQVAINNSNIGKINYTKPANSILEIFNNITQDLFNKRQQNDFEIQTLKKTRDTLLPKLFSGELDVSELELDSVAH